MAEASPLDCPVCGENFDNPKLLGCNHVVCCKCIVDWLRETDQTGGCPLCRAPILPPSSHQGDLETLVDALPTDLTIVAKVESHKMLNSCHVCMFCDNNIAATAFCLQCNMKLCDACAKGHKKFAALKSHVIEELSKMTPQQLTAVNRSKCKNHEDRLAEHYCSTHQELICLLCSSTNHRFCTGVKAIMEAATEKREEFRLEAQRLREKETAMRTQIKEAKDNFAAIRAKANDIFDDLQRSLERQCQVVHDLIQAEEDQERAATLSETSIVDSVEEFSPADLDLDMEMMIASMLHDLEQQPGNTNTMNELLHGLLDAQRLAQMKAEIATMGQLGHRPPALSEATPAGPSEATPPGSSGVTSTATGRKRRWAEMARSLQVGDRVVRGPDWSLHRGSEDGGGQGTVTAMPSRLASSQGEDPTGTVDVKWDTGREDCYYMGRDDRYELELV